MIHIAHYHNLTWRRRERLHLPELRDPNDLPRPVGEGANQVKTEENEENFQAEERIRKRIEGKKSVKMMEILIETENKALQDLEIAVISIEIVDWIL